MAKARPSRLRPLTLRLLTAPARAQQKNTAYWGYAVFPCQRHWGWS
ncbi:conserved hypothetical protein [Lacticaseibacillus rhamnosus ATCC 8530]|nr:conserved hypothetical protein [Lacticaseibacillus rhamnosus ATCC 8530]